MVQLPAASAPTPRDFPGIDHPIRWGFMATGNIAKQWARCLRELPDEAELTAVGSRTQSGADRFAAEFGVRHAFGSYAELAECPEVDAVYVASPHSHHLEHALAAIEAGKHVLVEKPLTPTLEQSTALLEAASRAGVFVMEALWTRCHPLIRKAQQVVASGALGELRLLEASFSHAFDFEDESHRLLDPELAGGAILDLGVYPAHVSHALLGPAAELVAGGTLAATGVDASSLAQVTWRGDGGATFGALFTSLEAEAVQRLELVGTRGRLVIDHFLVPERLTVELKGAEPQEFTAVPAGYIHQANEVHRCLHAGLAESPLVPWQSTLEVSALLDAWLQQVTTHDGQEATR